MTSLGGSTTRRGPDGARRRRADRAPAGSRRLPPFGKCPERQDGQARRNAGGTGAATQPIPSRDRPARPNRHRTPPRSRASPPTPTAEGPVRPACSTRVPAQLDPCARLTRCPYHPHATHVPPVGAEPGRLNLAAGLSGLGPTPNQEAIQPPIDLKARCTCGRTPPRPAFHRPIANACPRPGFR